jgi:hypothetical protein
MGVLFEFVKARVGERSEWARDHLPPGRFGPPPNGEPYWLDSSGHPIIEPRQQVQADVHAMDVLLTLHMPSTEILPDANQQGCVGCGRRRYANGYNRDPDDCPVLRALAWRWHTHPGWRTEWTPPVPMRHR